MPTNYSIIFNSGAKVTRILQSLILINEISLEESSFYRHATGKAVSVVYMLGTVGKLVETMPYVLACVFRRLL